MQNSSSKEGVDALSKALHAIHVTCLLPDGSDDPSKANQLAEIYALSILYHNHLQNFTKVKQLVSKVLQLNFLLNPKTTAIIYKHGGIAYLREGRWTDAHAAFVEAFRNFEEAGARAESILCLQYLVFACLLSGSGINPFHDPGVRVYTTNTEVSFINTLAEAYLQNSLFECESILDLNKHLLNEDLVQIHVPQLLKSIKKRILVSLTKSCMTLCMNNITQRLHLTLTEVEALIVEIILEGEMHVSIDQVNAVLCTTNSRNSAGNDREGKYISYLCLVDNIGRLSRSVLGCVE